MYGNNWKKFVDHKNIKIFDPVQGRDFWLTLQRYRIQLNLMRPHNPDAHNMRSFEVRCVGGILLAPDTLDHNQYFVSNKEIFLYTDLQSCMEKIKYLLSLSALQADIIRVNARRRSVESKYSYQSRAQQSLKFLKKLYES